MKVRSMVIIAVFASLSVVLSLLKVFQMPNGGSISLYLVPLMFVAFKFDFKSTLICCFVSSLLQIMLSSYILGFFQLCLDYIIPLCLVSLLSLVDAKNLIKFIPYSLIVGVMILSSYVLSGMIYFKVDFVGSLVYNATFFVPTFVISIILALLVNKVNIEI